MKLSQFGRLLQINHVLGRHRLDELILAIHFFRPYRFLSWFSPYRWRHKADLPRGERIRLALQDRFLSSLVKSCLPAEIYYRKISPIHWQNCRIRLRPSLMMWR